jgi:hypothetical protein
MGAHGCADGGGTVRVDVVFRDVGKAVLSKGVKPVRLGADSVESFHVGWESDTVGGMDGEMAVVGAITDAELACWDVAKFMEGD